MGDGRDLTGPGGFKGFHRGKEKGPARKRGYRGGWEGHLETISFSLYNFTKSKIYCLIQ